MTTTIYQSSTLEKRKNNWKRKAQMKHNFFYQYPFMDDYINNSTYIRMLCPIHGIFRMSPNAHKDGNQGCPKCGHLRKNIDKHEKAKIDFEKAANKTHNNKYIYTKVVYIKSDIKVEILCKEHGVFWLTPAMHVYKRGCPICSKNKRSFGYYVDKNTQEANDIYYMYIMKIEGNNESFYKAGITNNLNRRKYDIKFESKGLYKATYIHTILDTKLNCFNLEQKILNKNRRKRNMYLPNIHFCGKTECFN